MLVPIIAASMLLTQSAQQFDLICTGTMNSGSNLTPAKNSASSARYRVDLDRMVWCADDCRSPRPFVRANAAELVMLDEQKPDGSVHQSIVNRTTGTLRSRLETRLGGRDYIFVNTDAVCTKADYTPIPAAAF